MKLAYHHILKTFSGNRGHGYAKLIIRGSLYQFDRRPFFYGFFNNRFSNPSSSAHLLGEKVKSSTGLREPVKLSTIQQFLTVPAMSNLTTGDLKNFDKNWTCVYGHRPDIKGKRGR